MLRVHACTFINNIINSIILKITYIFVNIYIYYIIYYIYIMWKLYTVIFQYDLVVLPGRITGIVLTLYLSWLSHHITFMLINYMPNMRTGDTVQ